MIQNIRIKARLILILIGFGVFPALLMIGALEFQRGALENNTLPRLSDNALAAGRSIDATLNERLGDVTVFAGTTAALDPANWRRPGADNILVAKMNDFAATYGGFYRLLVMISPGGEVLAVNTTDGRGKPLRAEAVYKTSFASDAWFKDALAGRFLAGKNGPLGMVFVGPLAHPAVTAAVGSEERTLIFAAPVKDADGKVIGVWANFADLTVVQEPIDLMLGAMKKSGFLSTQILVVGRDGKVMAQSLASNGPESLPRGRATWIDFDLVGDGGYASARAAVVDGRDGAIRVRRDRDGYDMSIGYSRTPGTQEFLGSGWSILVRLKSAELYGSLNDTLSLMLVILLGAVIAILAVGWMVGRGVAAPLVGLDGAMKRLAGGEKQVAIPHADRRDEIGDMARSVDAFRVGLIRADELEAETRRLADAADAAARRTAQEQASVISGIDAALSAMAGGDLTHRIAQPFAGGYDALREKIHVTFERLAAVIVQVGEAAGTINHGTSEVSQATDDLSSRTQQQAASLEETVAATEQLSRSVKQTAETARQADQRTTAAKGAAETAGRVSGNTVVAMGKIEGSSKEMVAIVDVIEGIAFQTNLLALNAGVEAARAGEAGMGFAVVATEVRALAQRCSEAAKQIKDLITASEGHVTEGVKLVQASGRSLAQVSASIGDIAGLVQAIANACAEQSIGIGETTVALGDIDQNTQRNAAMVDETSAAARTMAAQAHQLVDLVAQFRTDDRTAGDARGRAPTTRPRARAA